MSIFDLEQIVKDEWEALNRIAATRPMTTELGIRFETLRQQLISHERELCLAKQLPTVLPLKDWPLKWTRFHKKVHLSSTEAQVALTCEVYQSTPDMFAPATVTFYGSLASRLVLIDYENIEEFSMYHSGLDGLGAYSVENSAWMQEINRDKSCADCVHFLFCFDSCLVEVIAKSFDISLEKERRGTGPGDVFPV